MNKTITTVPDQLPNAPPLHGPPCTREDIYYFREGTHTRLYQTMGAHLVSEKAPGRVSPEGVAGAHFAVWAPNAERVSVMGDFNGWQNGANPLAASADGSGIWQGFVGGVESGARYKYRIESRYGGYSVEKADPFAFYAEAPPDTASRVWDLDYEWGDDNWMAARARANSLDAPWSIYEMHLGSWMRRENGDGGLRYLSFTEVAEPLADYLTDLGFTHVQFLPLTEHPFYG
ncbi:MAG: hypothetical protein WD448_07865, partial [Woeseia sp.]